MAIPFPSVADLPQGFESATINSVAYKVDAVSLASEESRVIERTDENGDASDFMLRVAAGHIQGSLTIQRALTTTVLPPAGTSFTYDYDRSGTASTLVTTGNTVQRDKDSFDTFEVPVILQAYQA